ncbi:MAG TPA: phospholipid carrier-dependent glycosyltransferase [Streptosporangiaceae bacterium]|nr:phospholipid carrier-dependent glycosyltransferase [Streptosporangiaceae bacterium]
MGMPSTGTGERSPSLGRPTAQQGTPDRPAARAWHRLRCVVGSWRDWAAMAREHWLLTAFLAVGLVLRVLTQVAYQPAILYIDSIKYLLGDYPGNDPPGYNFALKPILLAGNLGVVAALQHLLGLAMAVTLYAVLLRRGSPRWLAALAVAPVLLDGYQLQIEQNIMPDVMFETLIVAGLAFLLWDTRPRLGLTAAGGFALGSSATARQIGEIFIVPALLFVLVTVTGGWRLRLKHAATLCVAFAVPVLLASYVNYVGISPHRFSHFSLAPYASGSVYGRAAAAADCATLVLPSYERPLCPTPWQQHQGPDWLDHMAGSPVKKFTSSGHMGSVFARHVLEQQPLRVAAAIAKSALTLFAVDRNTSPGDTPIARWQFQDSFIQYPPYVTVQHGTIVFGEFSRHEQPVTTGTGAQFGSASPTVLRPLASFLRAYQLGGGYTPGPLLAFAAIAGLIGTALAIRRRRPAAERVTSQACLLFSTCAVAVLLASDFFEFSWRYQLPALVTLPPAAALAITLVVRMRGSQPSRGSASYGSADGEPAAQ